MAAGSDDIRRQVLDLLRKLTKAQGPRGTQTPEG
jgi:hypothetical protein